MINKKSEQRKLRVRSKIRRLSSRPRLSVFRSNKLIYAQVIDDTKGVTLAAAYGDDSNKVGEEVAKKSLAKKVKDVVFDKGGYRYHGRVKALADGARKGGLNF
ncbi:MAG: 50S ribosomal protein L18 [Candidatus Woesebacteria bacterium]|nr:50S ribosomal protein L18 [Candidatus Woesebacteria bacterium]